MSLISQSLHLPSANLSPWKTLVMSLLSSELMADCHCYCCTLAKDVCEGARLQLVLDEIFELFISEAFDNLFAKLCKRAFGTNCSDVLAIRQTNLARSPMEIFGCLQLHSAYWQTYSRGH